MAITNEYRQLIGGEWVPGGDGTYDIINPATEQVVAAAPEASAEARELLAGTKRTITDIAHGSGFSSSQYFSNVFRKYAGTTPSRFRSASGKRTKRA